MPETHPEKHEARLNSRIPVTLRKKLDDLAGESDFTISEICVTTFVTFWPEIEALMLMKRAAPTETTASLREYIDLCGTARARGVDIKATLTAALAAQIEAATPPPAPAEKAA